MEDREGERGFLSFVLLFSDTRNGILMDDLCYFPLLLSSTYHFRVEITYVVIKMMLSGIRFEAMEWKAG